MSKDAEAPNEPPKLVEAVAKRARTRKKTALNEMGAVETPMPTAKSSSDWLAARVVKANQDIALKTSAHVEVKQATLPVEMPEDPAIAQLPLWPDSVRAVPNALLRGALFSISKVRDVVKKRTLLASVKGIEVRFKGERLNQTDLDTWETLIHLARSQNLGSKVQFSAHSVLTMLGRHHGREQHEQLKEDIARLTGAVVEITIKEDGQAFGGTMVHSYYRDEVAQVYVIEISPQLLKLYQAGNTYIDWDERQQLGNANLAKWLHGFYSSHAAPHPYKVATIRDLCGAKADQRLGDFRKILRAALDLLVTKETSIIGWSIDKTDCVHVVRKPSRSQQRHLRALTSK